MGENLVQWKHPLEARMQWKFTLLPPFSNVLLDLGCGKKTPYRSYLIRRGNLVIFADVCKSPFLTIRLDAQNLPFRNKGIDFVFCSEVLEHVKNPQQLLNEIMRITDNAIIFYSTQLHVIEHRKVRIDLSPFTARFAKTGSAILFFGENAKALLEKSPCRKWGQEIKDVYVSPPLVQLEEEKGLEKWI